MTDLQKEMKAEDFIKLIEQNRFDKVSRNALELIAKRFRELEEALSIADVVESVCDCEKHLSLFPDGRYRCTKCGEWWYR